MKKWSLFIVLFVCLLLVTGCGKKNNDETKKVVEVPITKEEEMALMDRVSVLQYLDFFGKSFKTSDLTNQEALQVSFDILKSNDYDTIYFDDLERTALDYLDFSLEPENLNCVTHFNVLGASADLYLYDAKTGEYKLNPKHVAHGSGGFGATVFNKFVSGTKAHDTYKITVYKAVSDINQDVLGPIVNYYPTYNDSSKRTNKLVTIDHDKEPSDSIFSKIDDKKLVKHNYEFIKKNGNYVLINYEIAK